MPDIGEIWHWIERHAGEPFALKRGKPFSYRVTGNMLHADGASVSIHMSQFATALEHVPLESTNQIKSVWGPSYVYAILVDRRIRGADW